MAQPFVCMSVSLAARAVNDTVSDRMACQQLSSLFVPGSTKACYGHTEGTAGLHGVMLAVHTLQHAVAPPVQHLREMNPYVSAALADWQQCSRTTASISRVSCVCASAMT